MRGVMPVRSWVQNTFMKKYHPRIYARWKRRYGVPKRMPVRVRRKRHR